MKQYLYYAKIYMIYYGIICKYIYGLANKVAIHLTCNLCLDKVFSH